MTASPNAGRAGLLGPARSLITGWALLGGLVLVGVVLVNAWSILAGAIVNRPFPGDFELTEMGAAVAAFCFLPYCQLVGANVSADIFTMRAGTAGGGGHVDPGRGHRGGLRGRPAVADGRRPAGLPGSTSSSPGSLKFRSGGPSCRPSFRWRSSSSRRSSRWPKRSATSRERSRTVPRIDPRTDRPLEIDHGAGGRRRARTGRARRVDRDPGARRLRHDRGGRRRDRRSERTRHRPEPAQGSRLRPVLDLRPVRGAPVRPDGGPSPRAVA